MITQKLNTIIVRSFTIAIIRMTFYLYYTTSKMYVKLPLFRNTKIQKRQISSLKKDVEGRVYSLFVKYDVEKLRISTIKFLLDVNYLLGLQSMRDLLSMWLI